MTYCTWCCRIRTFMLNLMDKEQFSLPSVSVIPSMLMLQTHFSNLWMGMSVLSIVPTPQSTGEAGEKMILTEGRREYESQLAQWQRGAKRKCSVYPLGMCQVWVLAASVLLQFGNLLERSFTDQHLLKKITPDLLRKYMYLQNQIIVSCSDEEQPVLYAGHFQWKTPLSTFPLMNLPETEHPK